jgi:hypothetical protein
VHAPDRNVQVGRLAMLWFARAHTLPGIVRRAGTETIHVILLAPFVEGTDVIVEAKWNGKFYAAEVFMEAAVVTEVCRVF